jgi:hypothetical protein
MSTDVLHLSPVCHSTVRWGFRTRGTFRKYEHAPSSLHTSNDLTVTEVDDELVWSPLVFYWLRIPYLIGSVKKYNQ